MLVLLICLVLTFCLVFVKFVHPLFYWKKRKIFYETPWVRFFKVFFNGKSFVELVRLDYEEHPNLRYYGSYQFLKPSLFVRDLDLVKQITVKDFEYFTDHVDVFNGSKNDTLFSNNLFVMKGKLWRDLRSTLSPAFTSSKMKAMFQLITEAAENFTQHFVDIDQELIELEMKETYSKYANDVIASCSFGIKCDSMENPANEFYSMGRNLTRSSSWRMFRGIILGLFPKLKEIFSIPIFPAVVSNFFKSIVIHTISTREKEGIIRPDMIHLLMEARKGRLRHEKQNVATVDTGFATVNESDIIESEVTLELTDDVVTAQAMIFFFAGFDTTSTLLGFLSYELAKEPEIQQKLQAEIDSTLKRVQTISYEDILQMKYLDQVISEALRKWTPGFALSRVCTKEYTIPPKNDDEVSLTLSKGCYVSIPVCGIHHDPKYFPNPDVFDPDRFNDENKSNIIPGSYLPFGNGPRNCIGSRFALLETKALMTSLLTRFDLVIVKKTRIPPKLTKTLIVNVKGGLWLGIKKRAVNQYAFSHTE